MKKLLTILSYEAIATLKRRSFQYAAIGIPLVSLLLFGFLPAVRNRLGGSNPPPPASLSLADKSEAPLAEGFVDPGGLVQQLPSFAPQEHWIAYPSEAAARQALQAGEIAAFFLISPDYLTSGEIVYVRPEINPLDEGGQARLLERILLVNLLGGDEKLASLLQNPLSNQVEQRYSQPDAPTSAAERDRDNPWTFFLPYGTSLLFYIIILMSASLLLSSISRDKENRLLEVLLISASPGQILSGKILGLGLCGLLQAALWLGVSALLMNLRGVGLPFMARQTLPSAVLLIGLVYFVLGYGLYAVLMAAIGALVPNLREASQLSLVLVIPLLAPIIMILSLVNQPNGPIAVLLSLFPLTAPVSMPARLVATSVPPWQVLLSIALLIASILAALRLAGRLFRAQMLLSGQSFSLHNLRQAIK